MPASENPSPSDLKLPSGPTARRRRSANENEWVSIDNAERRRPILALSIVGALLIAGVVLVIAGFRS